MQNAPDTKPVPVLLTLFSLLQQLLSGRTCVSTDTERVSPQTTELQEPNNSDNLPPTTTTTTT